MERLKIQEPEKLRKGVSLKELHDFVVERRKGKDIPAVSKKVSWLAESIETESFWLELNRHMAEDNELRQRHSLGGIFCREPGRKMVKNTDFNWSGVFTALDNFLKEFV